MIPTAFIAKWRINSRNERAAAQEHFLDLCALLDEPTPNSDPTGAAAYAFEKGGAKASGGEGWADVWRRGRFAWEYKGKHKDLDAAHRQLSSMQARWRTRRCWSRPTSSASPSAPTGPTPYPNGTHLRACAP